MNWIATFYSHFGAVRYMQQCKQAGLPAKLTPVPRDLSSSCGTCVRYEAEHPCSTSSNMEEVEQVVEVLADGYRVHYRAENS